MVFFALSCLALPQRPGDRNQQRQGLIVQKKTQTGTLACSSCIILVLYIIWHNVLFVIIICLLYKQLRSELFQHLNKKMIQQVSIKWLFFRQCKIIYFFVIVFFFWAVKAFETASHYLALQKKTLMIITLFEMWQKYIYIHIFTYLDNLNDDLFHLTDKNICDETKLYCIKAAGIWEDDSICT